MLVEWLLILTVWSGGETQERFLSRHGTLQSCIDAGRVIIMGLDYRSGGRRWAGEPVKNMECRRRT